MLSRFYQPRLELLEDRLVPSIFTVNTTSDDLDGGTLADPAGPDGTLSLREAITVANLNPGSDMINFNIPGTGVPTIFVGGTPGPTAGTPLPVISDPLEIDGPSQLPQFFLPGVELDGTSAGNGANGLEISAGNCLVKNLEINRFGGNGVLLESNGNDSLKSCYIGTNIDATANLGNGGNGVFINNVGFNSVDSFCIIGGSGQNGVLIQGLAATQNQIIGYVGTTGNGNALPNALDGILIDNAPGNSYGMATGGFTVGSNGGNGIHIRGSGASGNMVVGAATGNQGNGIWIDNAPNNTISAIASGNQQNGIWIDNAPNNTVGGFVFGNDQNGILIQGVDATGNTVSPSQIGNMKSVIANAPNNLDGIRIDNAPNNLIGNRFGLMQISGNGGNGIHILGAGATGNTIRDAYIGVAAPNGGSGIFIDNASGTTIDSHVSNVISGNSQYGILIQGSRATNNSVRATEIGPYNGSALPNNLDGICIDGASANTIGGSTVSEPNIISGNAGNGVRIRGAATGNLLLGYVISGNSQNGILIQGAATGNMVQGNVIGLTAASTGATSSPNGLDGIRIDSASGNMIGAANASPNTISGNTGDGIHITGTGASGNIVQNNHIGLNFDGTGAMGNKLHGVALEGTGIQNNVIGGTAAGAGNIIAFNGSAGVAVFGDPTAVAQNTGNAILGNIIHDNALGIDLVSTTTYPTDDGVTMNTPGGPHSGPNQLQNYPVLISAIPFNYGERVTGSLNSTPNTTFRIDLFGNKKASLTGFGEGTIFLGSGNMTTDVAGNGSFTLTVPVFVVPGQFVCATATDPANNTSEFSKDLKVSTLPSSIVGRYQETGQLWMGQSTGSSFSSQLWATLNPNATWVDPVTGDFNGDGREDFAARNAQTGEWWVALSSGSSFSTQVWTTWSTQVTWVDVRAGDFNGDGKADILGRYAAAGQWWMALSNGSSFTNQLWETWNKNVNWTDVIVGDFNGDGRLDFAGRQAGEWWVTLSPSMNAHGFTFKGTTWSTAVTWVDVQVGDFNGDGLDDIAGRAKEFGQWWVALSNGTNRFSNQLWTTWSTAVDWVDVKVADFNGDGRDDIAGRASNGEWWVAISNGSQFMNRKWTTWSNAVTWLDVQIGDFNNDGLMDIAGRTAQGGQWWVALSDGSQFTNQLWATWSTIPTWVDVTAARF